MPFRINKIFTVIVLSLLSAQIFLWAEPNVVRQLATPLGPEYTTDMRAFLKTYQLMESGQNFYPAFWQGMAGLRAGNFHPDINAWRQPFIFYLWKLLPGDGSSIYFLWQIFLVAILISSYLITKNILSPLLLAPYLRYSLKDLTLLQPEWWGMAFLIFGLTALIKNKSLIAGMFFALCLACREPFAVTILPILIYKRNWRLIMPIALFAFYFLLFHLPNIMNMGTLWFRDYANGNWKTLHSIFAFASWEYPIIGIYRPFVILFIFTTVGFIIRRKNPFLLTSFLPFFLFAFVMAATGKIDATRDYWSIYFIPLLLISAPGIIFPPGKYEKTL